jgi:hypothetical protein
MAKRDERLEQVLETMMHLAQVLGQQVQSPQPRATETTHR